jgi:hypothetical protein
MSIREYSSDLLADCLIDSVRRAQARSDPFPHMEMSAVFPDEVYRDMSGAMPRAQSYRPMSGRSYDARPDGAPTRVKIDLLPEAIRHLPPNARKTWALVGAALRSKTLQQAFTDRLDRCSYTRLYPMPTLTRDVSGYQLAPHPDARSKAITVQFYLPPDASLTHLGTVFHRVVEGGQLERDHQKSFVPNTGYAFAVSDTSWHSVDLVEGNATVRDSILLTYYFDTGYYWYVNRLKRVGNFIRTEFQIALRLLRGER